MTEIERLAGDPPSPWEGEYGFSRLVRVGELVISAGTTSVDGNGVVVGRSPYEQAVEIFRKLEHELPRIGARIEDVVQTRMYVTDISRADEVGRAHSEFFGSVRPVTTMVEVAGLIDPRMLVEVEVTVQLAGAA
ncbi:MAG TPA: RidA family protein [Solirubrobacteraceae bacterium]|nr:RidA family protein [Solirubrobacteraceae bacterium]